MVGQNFQLGNGIIGMDMGNPCGIGYPTHAKYGYWLQFLYLSAFEQAQEHPKQMNFG
jgi:hypothetical protein